MTKPMSFEIRPDVAIKRRQRQLSWLKEAIPHYNEWQDYKSGILLNRQGGTGFNKDLRELVDRGLLKMVRVPYSKGWGGNYDLNKTMLVITEKGQLAVDRGTILE